MPKHSESQIIKRQRTTHESHRWTVLEAESMLELVVEVVKDNPETYEKPTAQKFFQRIGSLSPLLNSIDWICMKSKMRYLKGTYLSAVDWQGKTGAGLLETGDEKSVTEYVKKICPFFNYLEQIFGTRKNIVPNIIYQSNDSIDDLIVEITNEDPEFYMNDDDNVQSSKEDEHLKLSPVSKAKDQMKLPKTKCRASCSNNIGRLLSLQERKLDLEVRKFEEQIKIKKQDFEVRKLEIEKEERVQRYELELKYMQ